MSTKCKLTALLLAVCMIITLFAGCGGTNGGQTEPTPPPTSDTGTSSPTKTPDTSKDETPAPDTGSEDTPALKNVGATPDNPYNFAKGKYELGDDGLPLSTFEYELPLCATDEVLTWLNLCYVPQYLPDGDMGQLDFRKVQEEMTGIHVEYVLVTSANVAEQYAVRLASDDLCDLNSNAWNHFTGSTEEGLDDFFVNLHSYREYMPNYLYWLRFHDDIDATSKVFYDKETIIAFWNILQDPVLTIGMAWREDWLQEYGLTASEIKTFDQVHDTLALIKADGKCEFPTMLNQTLEYEPAEIFTGFNTAAYISTTQMPKPRVVNGRVEFTLMQQDDFDLVSLIYQWYDEGLLNPTLFSDATGIDGKTTIFTTDQIAWGSVTPSEIADFTNNAEDPDALYLASPRTLKTEDQIPKFHQKPSYFNYGSSVLSQRCENLELAVTFCDWAYCESGAFYLNYGIEGQNWNYNADGELRWSEFITTHVGTMSWALTIFTLNGLCDHGLQWFARKYRYDGGDQLLDAHLTWATPGYKGEYDWPVGINFTAEQEEELLNYTTDIVTYIAETYIAFTNGSKPLSEWDSYVAQLEDMNIEACRQIYQEAYDDFMAIYG